jgi:hypothetical protein
VVEINVSQEHTISINISFLKMEVTGSSEAIISTYKNTQRHSPKDHNLNTYSGAT